MSTLHNRISVFRKSGVLVLMLLFACFASLAAQENKDNQKKKEERSQKASQQKQRDQGGQPKGPSAQSQRAHGAPASPAPQSSITRRAGGAQGRPESQGTTAQSKPGQSPAPEQKQRNRDRQPASPPAPQSQGQANQNQQRGHSGNQPTQPNQNRTDQNQQRGRIGNQPIQPNQGTSNLNKSRENPSSRPLPQNQSARGGGGAADRPRPREVVRYSNGQPHTIRMSNGGMVRRTEAGRVVEVRTPGGTVIRHAPTGVRRVEVVRPGDRVIVSMGRNQGYVQRPVVFSNRHFVQRTYLVGGMSYSRIYRPVTYRGVVLHIYTPMRYYRPAFYSWAYRPWPRPFAYSWGWLRDPWYGFYGGYFVPYPSYVSPALWLTDFMIAATLQEAYEERMAIAAASPPPGYPPLTQSALTPEVKQLIADEVSRQIEMDRAESQNVNAAAYGTADSAPLFADNSRHTFVVSNALLVNSGSQECALGEGDVIQTLGAPAMNSPAADAIVLASKPQDCRQGAAISVQLSDLQEMQNHMRETVDRGLGELQSRGGQAGLPAPPYDSTGTTKAPFADDVTADTNVANELAQVSQEAEQAEQKVIAQSDSVVEGTDAAPITISLGQTIEQVVAVQGQPQKIFDLGNKKIYVYPDIKITFIDGRVADVQ